jgi:hypothetical protein
MFDCPTLATALLQYHIVFHGAHGVEMKAAFTNPFGLPAELASPFVHHHVTTTH